MSESLRELERVKDSLMAARRAVVIAHSSRPSTSGSGWWSAS